jgi:hypothetical protein
MAVLLLLQLLTFSVTLWFGLYLLLRDSQKLGLRFAGLGLMSYAVGLAVSVVANAIPATLPTLTQWRVAPILLPSLFWMAATWFLYPESAPPPRPSRNVALVLAVMAALLVLSAALIPAIAQVAVIGVPLVFIGITIVKVRLAWRSSLPRLPLMTLAVATMFLLLATGLLILPLAWLSNQLVLLGISVDMLLLGVVIGTVDAYEEGTALLPDALRSFVASGIAVTLLVGQIVLLLLIVEEASPLIIILPFTVSATAIGLEAFSGKLQAILDRLIFANRPSVYQERTVLRSINEALPRTAPAPTWQQVDEDTFMRLTRRALSHYNDLDKLAASPLTHMPLVTQRLQQHNGGDTMLERTHELKRLLTEAILHLKPSSDQAFGTTEAWRYYNVLYFPYVLAIKPYSARSPDDPLDATQRAALTWFQTQVPERTLYNWQTTAARLVATHLRDMQPEMLVTAPSPLPDSAT